MSRTSSPSRAESRGHSLVELAIAAALGAILLAVGLGVVGSTGRVLQNQLLVSDGQEQARMALSVVAQRLRAVGFGGVRVRVTSKAGISEWPALYHFRDPSPPAGSPGTDVVIAVVPRPERRSRVTTPVASLASGITIACGLQKASWDATEPLLLSAAGRPTLVPGGEGKCPKSGLLTGTEIVLRPPAGTPEPLDAMLPAGSLVTPASLLRFEVRNGSDGVPRLLQTTIPLDPAQPPAVHELARGVESLVVAYGLDDDGDGLVDTWDANTPGGPVPAGVGLMPPTAAPPASAADVLERVVSLRLWVSVRTARALRSGSDAPIATTPPPPVRVLHEGAIIVGDAQAKSDGHLHRLLMLEVVVPNLALARL